MKSCRDLLASWTFFLLLTEIGPVIPAGRWRSCCAASATGPLTRCDGGLQPPIALNRDAQPRRWANVPFIELIASAFHEALALHRSAAAGHISRSRRRAARRGARAHRLLQQV